MLTLHTPTPESLTIPAITSIFSVPFDGQSPVIGITEDYSIIKINITVSPIPSLSILSVTKLPLKQSPVMIIPVDPMAWTGPYKNGLTEHDVLLSVAADGELAFWVPEDGSTVPWRCTGKVKTCRSGLRKASCSSAKKTVLGRFYEQTILTQLISLQSFQHQKVKN